MKIAFIRESEIKDLNPTVEETKPLGATESCFIRLAQELSAHHTIKVFCPCQQKFYEKVEYIPLPSDGLSLSIRLAIFSPDLVIVVGNPRLLFTYNFLFDYRLIFWQQNHPLELSHFPIKELLGKVTIVLPSPEAKEYAQRFYNYQSIYGIYNAVRDEFFDIKSEKIKNKILYVGSLVRAKGFLDLLKITKILPQYDFNICGSFDMYGYVDESYKQLCLSMLSDNVKFLGGLNKKELAKNLGEAELCVVNPMIGNMETCCVSALESMVVGTPVVAGGQSIIDPIIQHGGISYTKNLDKEIKYVMKYGIRIDKTWTDGLTYKKIVPQWNKLFEEII